MAQNIIHVDTNINLSDGSANPDYGLAVSGSDFDLVSQFQSQSVVTEALETAGNACDLITTLVTDVQDGKINDTTGQIFTAENGYGDASLAGTSINTAAGAMLIDDLMQKISTKVQVAAQLLATFNRLQKEVTRALQG